jgi:hypothetical protein
VPPFIQGRHRELFLPLLVISELAEGRRSVTISACLQQASESVVFAGEDGRVVFNVLQRRLAQRDAVTLYPGDLVEDISSELGMDADRARGSRARRWRSARRYGFRRRRRRAEASVHDYPADFRERAERNSYPFTGEFTQVTDLCPSGRVSRCSKIQWRTVYEPRLDMMNVHGRYAPRCPPGYCSDLTSTYFFSLDVVDIEGRVRSRVGSACFLSGASLSRFNVHNVHDVHEQRHFRYFHGGRREHLWLIAPGMPSITWPRFGVLAERVVSTPLDPFTLRSRATRLSVRKPVSTGGPGHPAALRRRQDRSTTLELDMDRAHRQLGDLTWTRLFRCRGVLNLLTQLHG